MAEVRVTQKATKDLEAIAEFIARDSERYAKIQIKKFYASIKHLQHYPEMGRIVPEINEPLIREIIFGNYRIIYFILSTKRIDVIAVYHGARILTSSLLKSRLK